MEARPYCAVAAVAPVNVRNDSSSRRARETARRSTRQSLRVEVTSAATRKPIEDADVRVDGVRLAWSASTRAYGSGPLPHGVRTLRVRRLGYRPYERSVDIDDVASPVRVELHPLTTLLPEVVVAGRRLRIDERYLPVVMRAQSSWGELFTRDDLRGAYDVQSLLESIPGVRVQADRIRFSRCQDQLPGTVTPGKVQVYLDGVRLTADADVPDVQAIRTVSPAAVEVVEVYRGVSRIPGEFLNDACAVIALWTRPP